MHCVLSLPIHIPHHDRRHLREPGLAEQIDMWECERQFFREKEEEEVNLAGCVCRAGEREARKKEDKAEKEEEKATPALIRSL